MQYEAAVDRIDNASMPAWDKSLECLVSFEYMAHNDTSDI